MDKLQELLKSQEYDEEYFKVPALGTHYSQRWAMEDLLSEQREGSEPHGRNNEISNITPATIAQLDNKPGNSNKLVSVLWVGDEYDIIFYHKTMNCDKNKKKVILS